MRMLLLNCFAIHVAIGGVAVAEEPYPYLVHVSEEGALLRSGPGEEYYETSRLTAGTAVEVWREVPGGWLAVRPPRGSYSLVAAAHVRVRPDRVAEVVAPDVPAHVGSAIHSQRDVVQVMLAEGERVQVLETVTQGGEFWHKIAPPSGEFRWIHTSQIAGPPAKSTSELTESGVPLQDVAGGPAQGADARSFRIARHSAAAGAAGGSEASSQREESEQPPQTLAEAAGRATAAPPSAEPVTPAQIELELATIVAEDSRLWQFDNLKRLCEDLLSSAGSTSQSEEAEALLEKFARFEQIRDRKLAVVGLQSAALASEEESPPSRRGLAGTASVAWQADRSADEQAASDAISAIGDVVRIPDQPPVAAETPGRYDGIGTLRPVVSRRREAPRYALVDPQGDVVSFITPSPGVNLQPYVGQRVGVVGTRGYMPEFKRTHVTAARVTPLR